MSALNLVKGQKIDLTKENPGLAKITVGLGWDVISGATADLDASVFEQDASKKVTNTVFFGALTSAGIVHQGDNLTGEGDGDDEKIDVVLADVTADRLKFVVNIYDGIAKNQNFGMIENAYIRLVDADTGNELLRYDLSEDYSSDTAVIAGELYKHNGEWKFAALGTGMSGDLNAIKESIR